MLVALLGAHAPAANSTCACTAPAQYPCEKRSSLELATKLRHAFASKRFRYHTELIAQFLVDSSLELVDAIRMTNHLFGIRAEQL
jgi:hypothetical protein